MLNSYKTYLRAGKVENMRNKFKTISLDCDMRNREES